MNNNSILSEEEIVLAPPTELLDEAKEISLNTIHDEKFPFVLHYNPNQKNFLLSLLGAVCAIVEEDNEECHTISTWMNMTQLAFIKRSNCIERVKTDEGINPFLAEDVVNLSADTPAGDVVQETIIASLEAQNELATPLSINATSEAITLDGSASSVAASVLSSCDSHPANTDMAHAQVIYANSTAEGCICCPGFEQWFKFTAPASKKYTICTVGGLDTVGTLYDCYGTPIIEVDDYEPCGKINFRIIRNLTSGNTYYIKVGTKNNVIGSYTLRVTDSVLANSVDINKTSITLEKGVRYELPITPNYTYKGFMGARPISGLSISIDPSNASEQKIWWWEKNSDILECYTDWDDDGDRYFHVITKKLGTTKLYAMDWKSHGKCDECTVNVDNMLIYRTRNRERLGFYDQSDNNDINPITAEDLTYGSKSTQTMITNGTRIAMSDLNDYNSISQRVTIIKNFFNSQINYDETFMEILSEMVDHFVDGTGTDYSNEALTSAVQSHSRTISYVNSVVTLVKNFISKNKMAVGDLAYDENLWTQPIKRATHPLVSAMNTAISNGATELYLPAYPRKNGVPGLTLAIDGFYGNKITLKDFQSADSTYSGTLEFTFYDHFGLDTPDLTDIKFGNLTAGTLPGFKQWFILQHWSDLEGAIQPKPFVTNVSFSVRFYGTYE